MVYGFNNVKGNFQLIPWTVGTLRIQRPDQNGTKRNRELVIIWWIWVMWKAKPNYFSQGKNEFFFLLAWISHFGKILLGSPFPFLLYSTGYFLETSSLWEICRQDLEGKDHHPFTGTLVVFPVHLQIGRLKQDSRLDWALSWQCCHRPSQVLGARIVN